jgi:hypothetical protein
VPNLIKEQGDVYKSNPDKALLNLSPSSRDRKVRLASPWRPNE